jgi:transposase-like protein
MEEPNMGLSRRKFTREFKLEAIERLESGTSVAAVARAMEVSPSLLQRWRQEFRESPGAAFGGAGKRRQDPDRLAHLERKIGQQTLEIDFLKGCLQRIEQQRQLQAVIGKPLSTGRSKTRETEPPR